MRPSTSQPGPFIPCHCLIAYPQLVGRLLCKPGGSSMVCARVHCARACLSTDGVRDPCARALVQRVRTTCARVARARVHCARVNRETFMRARCPRTHLLRARQPREPLARALPAHAYTACASTARTLLVTKLHEHQSTSLFPKRPSECHYGPFSMPRGNHCSSVANFCRVTVDHPTGAGDVSCELQITCCMHFGNCVTTVRHHFSSHSGSTGNFFSLGYHFSVPQFPPAAMRDAVSPRLASPAATMPEPCLC